MTKEGMETTEEVDGLDKSSPYVYIDRRACPTVFYVDY